MRAMVLRGCEANGWRGSSVFLVSELIGLPLVADGIAEANSRTTSVLGDELEARSLKRLDQHPIDPFREACRLILDLEGSDRGSRDIRRRGEIILLHTGKRSSRATEARCQTHSHWRDH